MGGGGPFCFIFFFFFLTFIIYSLNLITWSWHEVKDCLVLSFIITKAFKVYHLFCMCVFIKQANQLIFIQIFAVIRYTIINDWKIYKRSEWLGKKEDKVAEKILCTVRAPVFDRHQFFGTSEHYGKPLEVYYLDEWIIITLNVAGFLHPAIF